MSVFLPRQACVFTAGESFEVVIATSFLDVFCMIIVEICVIISWTSTFRSTTLFRCAVILLCLFYVLILYISSYCAIIP